MRSTASIFSLRCILQVIITIFVICPIAYSQSLSLTISTDKDQYLVGEQVWVRMCLHNTGSIELQVDKTSLRYCMIVEDSIGNRVSPNFHVTPIGIYTGLAPGYSIVTSRDINGYFGKHYVDGFISNILSPGTYTVYANSGGMVDRSNTVSVSSNRVTFRIVEPRGDDGNIFKQLCQILILRSNDCEAVFDRLVSFVDDYPESAYMSNAYKYLFMCDLPPCSRTTNSLIKYMDQFLVRYHNNDYVRNLISRRSSVFASNRNKEGCKGFFQDLIRKYPDTLIEREARWRLCRLDHLSLEDWLENPGRYPKEKCLGYTP